MPLRLTDWIDRRFYGGYEARWYTIKARDSVVQHLTPETRLLDFGAGRGAIDLHDWRQHAGFVAGVDVDPAVLANPHLHEAKVLAPPDYRIPYPDGTFDVVCSINVFEHVPEPVQALREIARVLRPGGRCVIQTPNRRHYIPVLASLTPHAFHVWYNRRRGRAEEDTFPTVYRCNTPAAVRRTAEAAGLATESVTCWEGRPEYLRLHPVPFLAGLFYERVVNMSERLAGFRCVLSATLRKPVTP